MIGRSKEEEKTDAFSETEAQFLAENFIGRVATVSPSGQPHVVPVAYTFDGSGIVFGGWNLTRSLKFRNLSANNKVAFVVDEIVSTRPWRVRGIEVLSTAQPSKTDGEAIMVRISPKRVTSWGLEA